MILNYIGILIFYIGSKLLRVLILCEENKLLELKSSILYQMVNKKIGFRGSTKSTWCDLGHLKLHKNSYYNLMFRVFLII